MKRRLAKLFLASSLSLANPLLADENTKCGVLDSIVNSVIAGDLLKAGQSKGLMFPLPDYHVLEEAKRCLPRIYETSFGTFKVTWGNQDFHLQGYMWYMITKINYDE